GIGHIGFILAGLSAIDVEAIKAAIIYIVIYSTLSLGSFAFLTILANNNNQKGSEDEGNDKIYQLSAISGLSKTNPILALSLTILMFSMTGIPPLGGFFAKFYVILAVISNGFYFLAVIALLSSVISAFYYLRIIKII